MKTATRLRGVERDIVQPPQAGDVVPYYEPQGNEIAIRINRFTGDRPGAIPRKKSRKHSNHMAERAT